MNITRVGASREAWGVVIGRGSWAAGSHLFLVQCCNYTSVLSSLSFLVLFFCGKNIHNPKFIILTIVKYTVLWPYVYSYWHTTTAVPFCIDSTNCKNVFCAFSVCWLSLTRNDTKTVQNQGGMSSKVWLQRY